MLLPASLLRSAVAERNGGAGSTAILLRSVSDLSPRLLSLFERRLRAEAGQWTASMVPPSPVNDYGVSEACSPAAMWSSRRVRRSPVPIFPRFPLRVELMAEGRRPTYAHRNRAASRITVQRPPLPGHVRGSRATTALPSPSDATQLRRKLTVTLHLLCSQQRPSSTVAGGPLKDSTSMGAQHNMKEAVAWWYGA